MATPPLFWPLPTPEDAVHPLERFVTRKERDAEYKQCDYGSNSGRYRRCARGNQGVHGRESGDDASRQVRPARESPGASSSRCHLTSAMTRTGQRV